MMKLSDLEQAYNLNLKISKIEEVIEALKDDVATFEVEVKIRVEDTYLDEEYIDEVIYDFEKDLIIKHYENQILNLKSELRELGVNPDEQ